MKYSDETSINKLVPKLIQKSNSLSKEMKYRMKINHIFSEFETKATSQFKFFISESKKRYLGSKFGAKIDFLLERSNKKGKSEAYKILNDNFYLNPDILNERKKLQKKCTNELHQNISDIINKIKGANNDSMALSKKKNKSIFKNKLISLNNINTTYIFKDKEKLHRNKTEINKIFNNEEKNLKTSFEGYNDYISKLKPSLILSSEKEENNYDNSNNKSDNGTIRRKYDFNIPRLELLRYKKTIIPKRTVKDEDLENRVNITKLLPYNISGRNILPKIKQFNTIGEFLNNNKDPFIAHSTSTIVAKKAWNEFDYFRRYRKKNEKIINKLGMEKMPNLKEYETMLKTSSKKMKLERKKKNEEIFNNQKLRGLDYRNQINARIMEKYNNIVNIEKDLYKDNKTIPVD